MRLIGLAVVLAVSIVPGPLVTEAQQVARIPRIGVLYPESNRCAGAFRQGLIDLGYVEGRTIAFEYRPGGSFEQHIQQTEDLVRRKVDLLVAANSSAAFAAKQVTRDIPILALTSDAVERGLVAGLARPGGNITGISLPSQELAGKRLEILKAAVPAADRIAVFIVPDSRAAKTLQDHEAAARVQGVTLHPINVSDRGRFDEAFRDAMRARARALLLPQGAFFYENREIIARLAIKHHLPMLSGETDSAQAGSLLYYGASIFAACRQLARFAHKILDGAKPADLPVEQPTKFELVINLRTAKALGLTIPQSLLVRADEIIQ